MTATLVQINSKRQVYTYFSGSLYFIVDTVRKSGYIKHESGLLIERVTGANYINYGINFIETCNI